MVTMTSSDQAPAGLELKAPVALAPRPEISTPPAEGAVSVDPSRATVTMIAAVTGTVDEVGDRIIPGAFARSLASRTPKVCRAHDWSTPIGRIVSIKELLPGDPRLPHTTGSGRPWPREAGALVAQARLNTAIKAGHDALEMIKFFEQEAAFSIGYRAVKTRRRGDVRELHDVEVFEVSPVLHGAHPDARLIGVKAGRPSGVEYKATTGVLPARRRAGMPTAAPCSVCGRPAAAVVPGGLRPGEMLICTRCVEVADDHHTDTATISAGDLTDLDELGPGPADKRTGVRAGAGRRLRLGARRRRHPHPHHRPGPPRRPGVGAAVRQGSVGAPG